MTFPRSRWTSITRPACRVAERNALVADVARVRDVLLSRADRLRYVLNGRTDPTMLAQVESYEDAAAEMSELLARYDRDPGCHQSTPGRGRLATVDWRTTGRR
jgi:hypothetical protein